MHTSLFNFLLLFPSSLFFIYCTSFLSSLSPSFSHFLVYFTLSSLYNSPVLSASLPLFCLIISSLISLIIISLPSSFPSPPSLSLSHLPRPISGCSPVWTTRNWQDLAGQGSGRGGKCAFHLNRRLRFCGDVCRLVTNTHTCTYVRTSAASTQPLPTPSTHATPTHPPTNACKVNNDEGGLLRRLKRVDTQFTDTSLNLRVIRSVNFSTHRHLTLTFTKSHPPSPPLYPPRMQASDQPEYATCLGRLARWPRASCTLTRWMPLAAPGSPDPHQGATTNRRAHSTNYWWKWMGLTPWRVWS